MPTAVEFMNEYRNLRVNVAIDDPATGTCRPGTVVVQLRKYFMMDWHAGTTELTEFNAVTGGKHDAWYKANKERIMTAAMGKGAPCDYALALEWAVRSGRIPVVNQQTVQKYCDDNMGIDCSGFVTNYLCAAGKKTYSANTVRNTSAESYYNAGKHINDPAQVKAGDVLVLMNGNSVKANPGHVVVVHSYTPQSVAGGNMRVVESTAASGANPKLIDSMYSVEKIIPKGGAVPVMILVVRRFGGTAHFSVVRL